MALVVEDGTGLANAESYASVADADTRLAARGFALWDTMSEAEKEQALRRSTDYMVQVYRNRWAGTRVTTTQALDWPRIDVPRLDVAGSYSEYPSDELPAEIVWACIDLAYKGAGGPLTPSALGRKTVREKVDVIEVEYDKNAPQYPIYKDIDDALRMFLKSLGSGVNRAVIRV
jgi:hypothetical protein